MIGMLTAGALAVGGVAVTVAGGSPASAATAASGTGTGYLHTSGNKIVDSTGATVRLTGISWFGMETANLSFHGLWASVTWKQQLDHMAQLGYNTLRVPYSGDALKAGAKATSVNDFTNPDLAGLSPLEILDKVVAYAGAKGMRVILDRHRPDSSGQTPLWYTKTVSEASMIADWVMLAKHYADNPTVVGADLFNEPHAEGTAPKGTGSCWGCGDTALDWRLAAQRIGNAILAVQPKWLIFVEGVSCLAGGADNAWDDIPDDPTNCSWWGGNLAGVAKYPVELSVKNQLVYSAHDYGVSVFKQKWFEDANFPNNLPEVWDRYWGYIYKQNIAPILVGEFGSTLADPLDVKWMTALMAYMGKGVDGMSFTYWSWNPNSGDTGGIVQDDWTTVNTNKQNIVGPYLIPPVATGSVSAPAASPSASQPVSSASPSAAAADCTAVLSAENTWSTGFQGKVTVTAGSAATKSWKVSWALPAGQSIGQLWNGTLVSSGGTATVSSLAWNGALAAGASASFGFQASGSLGTPTLSCTAA